MVAGATECAPLPAPVIPACQPPGVSQPATGDPDATKYALRVERGEALRTLLHIMRDEDEETKDTDAE
jgi:hypothetical protein